MSITEQTAAKRNQYDNFQSINVSEVILNAVSTFTQRNLYQLCVVQHYALQIAKYFKLQTIDIHDVTGKLLLVLIALKVAEKTSPSI